MYVDDGSDNGIAGIAVGGDGTSYLVYDDGFDFWTPQSEFNQGVGLATCTAGGCSTFQIASISIYDLIGAVITMGADGNPAIVYEDSGDTGEGRPDSVHYYTNGSDVTVSSNGAGRRYTQDVAIGPDGFARIAYVNSQNGVDFLQCTDASCDPPSATTISLSGPYPRGISIAVGSDGNALMEGVSAGGVSTYVDSVPCWGANCSSYSVESVPGSWESPLMPLGSLNLGKDGHTRMVATDATNGSVNHVRPRWPFFLSLVDTQQGTACLDQECSLALRYQVLDVNGSPIRKAGQAIEENLTTVSQVGCTASFLQGGTAYTDSTGTMINPDDVYMCFYPNTTGDCQVTADQTFTVNRLPVQITHSPYAGSHNIITFSCQHGQQQGCPTVIPTP